MNNFKEYENKLNNPYDRGGLLFDEAEYQKLKEDWQEFIAENQMEEMKFTQIE